MEEENIPIENLIQNNAPITKSTSLPKIQMPKEAALTGRAPITFEEALSQQGDIPSLANLAEMFAPKKNALAPVEFSVDRSRYAGLSASPNTAIADIEQQASQTQSYLDRLYNDVKVTGVNIGATFAASFTGISDMLTNLITDGSIFIKDDDLTAQIGSFRNKFEEENVNYETAFDKEHPILKLFLPSLATGSASGYGDILRTTGFALGAGAGILAQEAIITAATGGTGTIPALAANIRNLIRGSEFVANAARKVLGLRQGAVSLASGLETTAQTASTLNTISKLNYITGLNKNLIRGTIAAIGESEFEAQESREHLMESLQRDYALTTGSLPQGEDLERIRDTAEAAHDARFLLNQGLLTLTNVPLFSSWFKGFDKSGEIKELMSRLGKDLTLDASGNAVIKDAKKFTSDWWLKNKTRETLKPLAENSLAALKKIASTETFQVREGLEELYQYWIDKATENYYTGIYDSENSNINGALEEQISGLAKSFYNTKSQLVSQEGIQNLIGGILGGTGMQAVSKALNYKSDKKAKVWWEKEGEVALLKDVNSFLGGLKDYNYFQGTPEDFAKAANADSLGGTVSEKLLSLYNSYSASKQQEAVVSPFTYEALQDVINFKTIFPYLRRNQGEVLKQILSDDLKGYSLPQFNSQFGTSFNSQAELTGLVDRLIAQIDEINKDFTTVNAAFRNPYALGDASYRDYEDLKTLMSYHLFLSKKSEGRLRNLESEYSSFLLNSEDIKSAIEFTPTAKKSLKASITKSTKTARESIALLKGDPALAIQLTQEQRDQIADLEENINFLDSISSRLSQNLSPRDHQTLIMDVLSFNNYKGNSIKSINDTILNFLDYYNLKENLANHLEIFNTLSGAYNSPTELARINQKYKEDAFTLASTIEEVKGAKKQERNYLALTQRADAALDGEEFPTDVEEKIKQFILDYSLKDDLGGFENDLKAYIEGIFATAVSEDIKQMEQEEIPVNQPVEEIIEEPAIQKEQEEIEEEGIKNTGTILSKVADSLITVEPDGSITRATSSPRLRELTNQALAGNYSFLDALNWKLYSQSAGTITENLSTDIDDNLRASDYALTRSTSSAVLQAEIEGTMILSIQEPGRIEFNLRGFESLLKGKLVNEADRLNWIGVSLVDLLKSGRLGEKEFNYLNNRRGLAVKENYEEFKNYVLLADKNGKAFERYSRVSLRDKFPNWVKDNYSIIPIAQDLDLRKRDTDADVPFNSELPYHFIKVGEEIYNKPLFRITSPSEIIYVNNTEATEEVVDEMREKVQALLENSPQILNDATYFTVFTGSEGIAVVPVKLKNQLSSFRNALEQGVALTPFRLLARISNVPVELNVTKNTNNTFSIAIKDMDENSTKRWYVNNLSVDEVIELLSNPKDQVGLNEDRENVVFSFSNPVAIIPALKESELVDNENFTIRNITDKVYRRTFFRMLPKETEAVSPNEEISSPLPNSKIDVNNKETLSPINKIQDIERRRQEEHKKIDKDFEKSLERAQSIYDEYYEEGRNNDARGLNAIKAMIYNRKEKVDKKLNEELDLLDTIEDRLFDLNYVKNYYLRKEEGDKNNRKRQINKLLDIWGHEISKEFVNEKRIKQDSDGGYSTNEGVRLGQGRSTLRMIYNPISPQWNTDISKVDFENKINAKYDAEISALENKSDIIETLEEVHKEYKYIPLVEKASLINPGTNPENTTPSFYVRIKPEASLDALETELENVLSSLPERRREKNGGDKIRENLKAGGSLTKFLETSSEPFDTLPSYRGASVPSNIEEIVQEYLTKCP